MLDLFFDTETTGFINDRFPLQHEDQPHIVQLAAQLCDGDDVVSAFSLIIDNGVDIPARAAEVHGITTERAAQLGVSLPFALSMFAHLYTRADRCIAHNVKFDKAVVEVGIWRKYGDKATTLDKPMLCTMETAAPIVNLPPTERMIAAGINKPKAPKLEECIRHFFGEALLGAHDAMEDVVACRRVFTELLQMGAISNG